MTTPGYVTFLIDNQSGQVIDGTVSDDPTDRVPENPFQWKVICDSRGEVSIRRFGERRPELIGTATWDGGTFAGHRQIEAELPSDAKWRMVETTLGHELAKRAKRGPHDPTRLEVISKREGKTLRGRKSDWASLGPRYDHNGADLWARQRALKWSFAGFLGLMVVMALVFYKYRWRPPERTTAPAVTAPREAPPPPRPAPAPTVEMRIAQAATLAEAIALAKPAMGNSTDELPAGAALLARYRKLRWSDVEALETMVAKVQKDPEPERGKRLCAEGQIETITRRDVDRRKVFVGRLVLADGDALAFVAVGTTGELLKRMTTRFCGVVTGMSGNDVTVLGMFDLPENRTPQVEQ